YITPSCTIGIVSVTPSSRSRTQAMRRFLTFFVLIWSSGLSRKASYVRLYISQSPGEGFRSISSVTGVKFFIACDCGDSTVCPGCVCRFGRIWADAPTAVAAKNPAEKMKADKANVEFLVIAFPRPDQAHVCR